MTPEQFCYWMQGFVELGGNNLPTPEQWKSIGEHLQQVFNKKTPPVNTPTVFPQVLRDGPSQVPPYTPNTSWPTIDANKIIC